MKYTRIYADDLGESHFEDVEVHLTDKGDVGFLSADFTVTAFQFRENMAKYQWDYHTAPTRQFIILLDGLIEIETSTGEIRRFKAGDILLVEDTTGKGHRTKNILQQIRRSLFIKI
jgi:hypothetical protein